MNAPTFFAGLLIGAAALWIPSFFGIRLVDALAAAAWVSDFVSPQSLLVEDLQGVPAGEARPLSGAGGDLAAVAGTATSEPVYAYCPTAEPPRFVLGFARLKEQLGSAMGDPIECEHVNPENGDTLQQTSTGLAVYDKQEGRLAFTDGYRRWVLQPDGSVAES